MMRAFKKCARVDSNHHGPNGPQGPQPCASTNSATGAGTGRSIGASNASPVEWVFAADRAGGECACWIAFSGFEVEHHLRVGELSDDLSAAADHHQPDLRALADVNRRCLDVEQHA